MDNPRPEKVAVVDEVRERLEGSTASVVTEYRGLTVGQLAELRQSLRAAGADYKIFKNTLVRRAIDGSPHAPLEELLTGPTGITFVSGDVSAVAKTLRDFSRANANLVIKGGLLDGTVLSSSQLGALADLPSREVLLARLAGAIAAPMTQLAGLLQALPRNLAYGLKALVDQKGGVPEAAVADDSAAVDEAGTADEPVAEAEVADEPVADEPVAETEAAPTEAEAAPTEAGPAPETAEAETAEAEAEPAPETAEAPVATDAEAPAAAEAPVAEAAPVGAADAEVAAEAEGGAEATTEEASTEEA